MGPLVTPSARQLSAVGLALASLLFTACGHTDPWPTGPWPRMDPMDNAFPTQIVRQVLTAPAHFAWTADGTGVVYQYVDPAEGGRPCLGIVPVLGGTRLWSWCDQRSNLQDSVARHPAYGLSAGGRIAAVEGLYRRPVPGCPTCPMPTILDAVGKSLWISDTADPAGHRQRLASLPTPMGSITVSWATRIDWISEDAFIMAAARYVHDGRVELPEPLQLVRVQLGPTGPTFTPIAGTEGVKAFAIDASGDILLLRTHAWTIQQPPPSQPLTRWLADSVVLRVRAAGGPIDTIATTPARLGDIHCAGDACMATSDDIRCGTPPPGTTGPTCQIVAPYTIACQVACQTSRQVFRFARQTGMFTELPTLASYGTFRISPDHNRLAVIREGGLAVMGMP